MFDRGTPVANADMCGALEHLTGWKGDHRVMQKHADGTIYEAAAYDEDFLLKKLPQPVSTKYVNAKITSYWEATAAGTTCSYRLKVDALCALALELFKEGKLDAAV